MANAFSALSSSLKRNRSSSHSKKESKLNTIFNKIANPFSTNQTKKRKKNSVDHGNRRSSLSVFIDYFRSSEEQQGHPFANDALFEHNRYKQQKSTSHQNTLYNTRLPHHAPPSGILKKDIPLPTTRHRHTNSTPVGISTRRKKSSHIRHYSHVSCISASNITVNSEDLTAKEFADIAGIRILSEEEDHDEDEDTNGHSLIKRKVCTFCGDHESDIPSLIVTSSSRLNASSILNNNSSVYNSRIMLEDEDDEDSDMYLDLEPQIWDNDFWHIPGGPNNHPLHHTSSKVEPPPILHELKRSNMEDTFIRKGRFEIHLNNSACVPSSPKTQRPSTVVEWKRKSRPSTTLKHQVTA